MVVQKTISNLKERPKDERQVVAMGTAGAVVLVLLVGWAFFFLKSLRKEQAATGQLYEIPAETTTALPAVQTYQTHDGTPQIDQFGSPAQDF